jgi:hypothetical protein
VPVAAAGGFQVNTADLLLVHVGEAGPRQQGDDHAGNIEEPDHPTAAPQLEPAPGPSRTSNTKNRP